MIFETWFLLGLLAALAAGFGAFALKVAAAEHFDIPSLSFFASLLSSSLLGISVLFFSDFSGFSISLFFIALTVAMTYFVINLAKVQSLKYIDSTIFFPLYKVCSPTAVIIVGVLFFHEQFSFFEWLGLGLGLLIPLLLINKSENARQSNLFKGLMILILASCIAALSAAAEKYGTQITDNVWLFSFMCNVLVVPTAFVAMLRNKQASLVQQMSYLHNRTYAATCLVLSLTVAISSAAFLFAFSFGGTLSIVYTILSLYILIPIILSIIFYNEHWNARKVIAIILSIVALGFFG